MKVSIIIPAHNEEQRIGKTLHMYHQFFNELHEGGALDFEFVVVLNGCTDNTLRVVEDLRQTRDNILVIDLPEAGKGLAIRAGFEDALTRGNDLIGFVDADMATLSMELYALVEEIGEYDGIIASRYMPESKLHPPRPWMKRWGSRLVYEPLVWLLFGLSYYDLQCGAKMFRRKVIETITPRLTVRQWSFDVELLYIAKKWGLKVKELPVEWNDSNESNFDMKKVIPQFVKDTFKIRFNDLRGKYKR